MQRATQPDRPIEIEVPVLTQSLRVIDAGGVAIALDTAFVQYQISQPLMELLGDHRHPFMKKCEEGQDLGLGMNLIHMEEAILNLIIMVEVIVANGQESLATALHDTAEEVVVVVTENTSDMIGITIDIATAGLVVIVQGAIEIEVEDDQGKEIEGGIEIVTEQDQEIEGDGKIVRAPPVTVAVEVEVEVRALREVVAPDHPDESVTEIVSTSVETVMQKQLSLRLVQESGSALDLMSHYRVV